MKKFLVSFLVLVMICAMSITAFAASDTTLNITDSNGRTYNGYQLLDLTTSLKGANHHPATCTGEHKDDCYNYAYTVNEKYRAILQVETLDNGRNALWGESGKPATFADVRDDQILDYLEGQTSGTGTMRQVADRIYRAIKAANIEADKKNITGTNVTIEQGYWMFADVSALSGNEANSLVMVDTAGQDDITMNPKTALPTVEIKVKDIEDSEDDNITDNPWHDTADHDIGDKVPFKTTATLPENAQYYQSYKLVFHNTLDKGFDLEEGTYKVYMYETKYKADVDTDMNDFYKDVTANFNIKTNDLTDSCSFEVGCDNILSINGVTKDTAFVVYYEATLKNDADAANGDEIVLGGDGNRAEVYLEFSNNPYGTTTGKTETDKVAVYTYKLVVNKTDSHGHELEGAGFTLSKKDKKTGQYIQIGTEIKGADMTTFTWVGLDDGDYKLVETTVPEGYNKMSDVEFSISAEHSETNGEPALTLLTGGLMGEGDITNGTIEKDIINNTGTVLPETGAQGTVMIIFGSALIVMLAAVFMITRKKMSVYED